MNTVFRSRHLAPVMFWTRILAFCTMMFPSIQVNAAIFGPGNYDECILDSMAGVTSDVAARAIIMSCREKFPEREQVAPNVRELTLGEIEKITGQAGPDIVANTFRGNLYNGNSDVTVSEITINVTVTTGENRVPRSYTQKVTILPLATAFFSLRIILGKLGSNYSWHIIGARGY